MYVKRAYCIVLVIIMRTPLSLRFLKYRQRNEAVKVCTVFM